jgi:isoquinoline 1-oxidoreductase beta subunit
MEPMNAIADVKSDSCTIWAPTQVPDSVLRMVTRTLGLPQEKVTVHTTLLGGGFGRRLQTDFISEAVQLSKQVGKPVQVVWTREDDMTNDMYRPACYHTLKGAVAEGKPAGWSHQAIQAGWGNAKGFGDADLVYEIPKAGLRFTGVSTPVPTGPWRSVEHSLLHVVNECFFDELAHAAGKDPYAFRHENLKDDRVRNVLELAAKYSGWGDKLPAGHGRGIACFSGYGSCIAHVVELSVSGQKIKLHRVVAVVDCGLAINPKGVEAQVQGGCVDGLSTALRAAITIEKGGVVQTSWPTYRWMTMDAMPNIEVHVVSGGDQPGGMGEVGYPSVPAAVANAIFSATGKRVRKFPISLSELV